MEAPAAAAFFTLRVTARFSVKREGGQLFSRLTAVLKNV
jgi:hypothetical protein